VQSRAELWPGADVVSLDVKASDHSASARRRSRRLSPSSSRWSLGIAESCSDKIVGGMTGRMLLALGSLLRLAVGAGYLATPEQMVNHQLAPDIRGHPDGRMSTRGFGALHLGIAIGTLRAATRNKGCRELAVLNLVCALGDTAATLLERRDRGSWERVVLGSVPVDVVDVAWWINVLRYL
jgi:hypothetical protein